MKEFIEATPSAELLPLSAGVQDDESDAEMGFTYKYVCFFLLRAGGCSIWFLLCLCGITSLTSRSELSEFGILRKVHKLGPWSMYLRLLGDWKERPG